jgi:hypothetical protein
MDAQVCIGITREFKLRHAVLIYGDGSGAFCTLHKVRTEGGATPYLEPAQPLTMLAAPRMGPLWRGQRGPGRQA